MVTDVDIEAAMLCLIAQRGPKSSACPSEVARALLPDGWRALMPRVRATALLLQRRGLLDISQGGVLVTNLDELRGPIRIRQFPLP